MITEIVKSRPRVGRTIRDVKAYGGRCEGPGLPAFHSVFFVGMLDQKPKQTINRVGMLRCLHGPRRPDVVDCDQRKERGD